MLCERFKLSKAGHLTVLTLSLAALSRELTVKQPLYWQLPYGSLDDTQTL